MGSSPLARGLRSHVAALVGPARIIPARAGFTRVLSTGQVTIEDHPRSRGVYPKSLSEPSNCPGSSPLARGLPCCRTSTPSHPGDHPRSRGVYGEKPADGIPHRRIIPARAGFTVKNPLTAFHNVGSSPLARGLRKVSADAMGEFRIIPARAGFTLADPWNPNDEPHYQTAFAFTADLVLAPQSSDSAVVSQRSTRTPSEA